MSVQQQQQQTGKRQIKSYRIVTVETNKIPTPQQNQQVQDTLQSPDWIRQSNYNTQKQSELINSERGVIQSLRISSLLRQIIDDKLRNAFLQHNNYANIKSFTIIKNHYDDYDRIQMGGEYYEILVNDFTPTLITEDILAIDLMNHQTKYGELVQIFNYLQQMHSPLHYMIYKRAIEIVDSRPLHDGSDFLDKYIMPTRMGFYYAIIVNFRRSYSNVILSLPTPPSSSSVSSLIMSENNSNNNNNNNNNSNLSSTSTHGSSSSSSSS